jgi:peptidoglycan L-alanyl-D-glutamate endopeptidase CwlK
MNQHIAELQKAMGLIADGKRGPVTTGAILEAADRGFLAYEKPASVATPVPAAVVPSEWDERSAKNLNGVHPDLVKVHDLARTKAPWPYVITEGVRTLERQKQLLAAGASKTLNSMHLIQKTGFSHATDAIPWLDLDEDGKIETSEIYDWAMVKKLSDIIKASASELGVKLIWGGDWRTFKDGPHYELDRNVYL